MKKTKENTLYLPIKQVYFDAILKGEKTKEYREIKETTFKKYLEVWKEGNDEGIEFDESKVEASVIANSGNDPMIYNNGVYPYLPKQIQFLDLAVGYAKDRDTATVEVKDITFEPAKTKEGNPAVFSWSEEEGINFNKNGDLCIWQIVYHLGKIIEKNIK
ncbi:MAG: hypothetical protein ACOH1N_00545 [Lutibacter sp.]